MFVIVAAIGGDILKTSARHMLLGSGGSNRNSILTGNAAIGSFLCTRAALKGQRKARPVMWIRIAPCRDPKRCS
jgi:hypothetical protein